LASPKGGARENGKGPARVTMDHRPWTKDQGPCKTEDKGGSRDCPAAIEVNCSDVVIACLSLEIQVWGKGCMDRLHVQYRLQTIPQWQFSSLRIGDAAAWHPVPRTEPRAKNPPVNAPLIRTSSANLKAVTGPCTTTSQTGRCISISIIYSTPSPDMGPQSATFGSYSRGQASGPPLSH
jgi:hypothetical protein